MEYVRIGVSEKVRCGQGQRARLAGKTNLPAVPAALPTPTLVYKTQTGLPIDAVLGLYRVARFSRRLIPI